MPITTFTIATSETWKDGETGSRQEKTEWYRIVTWRNLAEICSKYLQKGRQVYIEGKIQTRAWQDKDGVQRYTTEIVAYNMGMLGGKRGGEKADESVTVPNVPEPNLPEDDIPF